MKLFDVDWAAVLSGLSRWSVLPHEARRVALHLLKPSATVTAASFGAQLDPLLASGIVQLDRERRRVRVVDEHRDLVRVLRAMSRHRVFDSPTPAALAYYLEEHYSAADVQALAGGTSPYHGGSRHQLEKLVAHEEWVGDLLGAASDDALAGWAIDRGVVLTDPPDESLFVLASMRSLVHELLETPDGVSLAELAARTEALGTTFILAGAVHAGLRLLVMFAGLRGRDLEPMIGLWPPAVHELRRPPSAAPAPLQPTERFELAVLMEDMTTVLATVAAEPLRLRANDLMVFARARQEIATRLASLPDWVAGPLGLGAEERVQEAAAELQRRGFADVGGARSGKPQLEATAAGTRWLALSPHGRLAALLDPMRRSRARNPAGAYEADEAGQFFPFRLPYLRVPKGLDLRATLTEALLAVGDDFVPVDQYLEHHSRALNPLLSGDRATDVRRQAELLYYTGGGDPRVQLREMWRTMLEQFLVRRLVAFGGASLGRTEAGALCFALTGTGRYLLGAAPSFEYGADEAVDIVVQPNFDVVFLAPAPAFEARIARFAERTGPAPGIAFRITRASVLAAAEAGASLDDVLGVLRDASSKPLPGNVEREIGGWMAAVRRARLRRTMLVECPDEETSARVMTALGEKARRLTPTVLDVEPMKPADLATLARRLRKAGVFIGEA